MDHASIISNYSVNDPKHPPEAIHKNHKICQSTPLWHRRCVKAKRWRPSIFSCFIRCFTAFRWFCIRNYGALCLPPGIIVNNRWVPRVYFSAQDNHPGMHGSPRIIKRNHQIKRTAVIWRGFKTRFLQAIYRYTIYHLNLSENWF